MFEKASRIKLRFTYFGQISVEDLWDLDPKQLDELYSDLATKKKQLATESLIEPRKANAELDLRIELVKHVFEVKQAEAEARRAAAAQAERRQKILEVMHRKDEEGLLGKTMEELEAMLIAEGAPKP